MYRVILEETADKKMYLISLGRVRVWEDVESVSPYMHFYNMGFTPTPIRSKATLFINRDEVTDILNIYSTKLLYPNAVIEEI